MAVNRIPRAVPLATVGGYLGVGKTTLINQLLTQAEGRRYVVFVNDFGAINIDVELVETRRSDRISFANGCVCCTLNEDFVAAVVDIASGDDPVDGILIEASGVADPRAMEASLRALEAAGYVRLDTALYVIDADQFGALDYISSETVIDHAAASDMVLINKADLVSTAVLDGITETLAVAAPFTTSLATTQCKIATELLFGNLARMQKRPENAVPAPHAEFFRWGFDSAAPIRRDSIRPVIEMLQNSFFRVKGFVRFHETPEEWHSINAVGTRAVIKRLAYAPETNSTLVLVGINPRPVQNLDSIRARVENLLAPAQDKHREPLDG